MFDSQSQRELRHGLHLWLEIRGMGLVTGASGVGKSICIRRMIADLPAERYTVHRFGQIPTTPSGFLRALGRRLGLRARLHLADMFEDIREALGRHEDEHGTHPVLIMDDAEGMRATTLDLVRRLTAHDLDGTEPVSILLVGTERLLDTLRDPILLPLRTRIGYAYQLRAFGM
ncbi:MAG: general secretion pathway protein A, partial [Kiritimatiellia bacterium]